MKTADYTFCGGPVVEYDETAPCIVCKLPVGDASMGGTAVCPACDCGVHRDSNDHWTEQETILIFRDKLTPQEARCAMTLQEVLNRARPRYLNCLDMVMRKDVFTHPNYLRNLNAFVQLFEDVQGVVNERSGVESRSRACGSGT